MTNYECYFGNKERTLDSLSMLLEFPDHPRKEVREFQEEVRKTGAFKWLQMECTNQRWYSGIKLNAGR
jgi:hypothetical protein